MTLWAEAVNATGREMLLENCNNGGYVPCKRRREHTHPCTRAQPHTQSDVENKRKLRMQAWVDAQMGFDTARTGTTIQSAIHPFRTRAALSTCSALASTSHPHRSPPCRISSTRRFISTSQSLDAGHTQVSDCAPLGLPVTVGLVCSERGRLDAFV
jgi:hypothetical protein